MACRQRTASAVTSGPTPSPGRTAINAFTRAALVAQDALLLGEQELHLIDAVEQAVAREALEGNLTDLPSGSVSDVLSRSMVTSTRGVR